MQKQEAELEEN